MELIIVAVFLLLIGLTLILLNIKGINRDKNSFREMLQVKEADTTETEVMIGELRREFSETILELQKEIIELRERQNMSGSTNQNIPAVIENKIYSAGEAVVTENIHIEEAISNFDEADNVTSEQIEEGPSENDVSIRNNSIKIDEIGKLLEKNISVDEICERLSIGKGEVLLIKELYLK